MQADKTQALHLLKKILLSDDRQKIEQLETELARLKLSFEDKQELITKLNPVIATLITQKISDSRDEMAEVLAPIMGSAIKKQIRDAKESIIDALYPVIGQTIRKAVTEAMKNLAKTVNEKLDRAFSFPLLFKRIRAKLSGVSTAELLLNESLPFQVHEIFYIHKETGILLAQASLQSQKLQSNPDLISGMLTAIRNFSSSAFEKEEGNELNRIEYENLQIYLEVGRYAYLAVVTSGIPPETFFTRMHEKEMECHRKYAEQLRHFEGDTEPFSSAAQAFESTFSSFNKAESTESTEVHSSHGWVYFLILLILAGLAYFFFFRSNAEPPPVATVSDSLQQAGKEEKLRMALIAQGLDTLSNIHFIVQGTTILLEGNAESETRALQLARQITKSTQAKIIINHLNYPKMPLNKIEQLRIYFKPNSSELDSVAKDSLLWLSQTLKTWPHFKLLITGHSDTTGNAEINRIISEKRAAHVAEFLIQSGIPANQLKSVAQGSIKHDQIKCKTGRMVNFEIIR